MNRRTFISAAALGIVCKSLPTDLFAQPAAANGVHQITLSDGRKLGFETFGDPVGWPVLYFHGIPGCRLEARLLHQTAVDQGCRIVAIDRPGMGLSDYHGSRQIIDWVNDVTQLINSDDLPADLKLGEFSIVGASSGAPYALACAAKLPPARLRSVAIVSGVAPLDKISGDGGISARAFRFVNRRPRLARIGLNVFTRRMHRRPNRILRISTRYVSGPDARILSEPGNFQSFTDIYFEAVRCGPDGVIRDMSLLACPWGFSVSEVRRFVRLWYGECDMTTPPASMGAYLRDNIANNKYTLVPGEGHVSVVLHQGNEILRQLKQDASSC